jgi:glucosamine-6-phosphate deaminase
MTNSPIIAATAADLGDQVADVVVEAWRSASEQGRDFLLGCPTGRTPSPVFKSLATRLSGIDGSTLVVVLMDEYLNETAAGYAAVDPGEPYSCVGYAKENIIGPIAAATGQEPQLWFPEPGDPEAYDRKIAAAGGIDVFLLASGASDGHIAFNPPGSPRDSLTRVIELPDSTRRDNMATFPVFEHLEDVPRHGVSVGVSTIVDQTRLALLMLTGADKRVAFERINAASDYDPAWPATAVAACRKYQVFADAEAARH